MFPTCWLPCLLIKKYLDSMIKIYHNQRCSKSRCVLDILKESQAKFSVIDYQKNPPTKTELNEILTMLGMKPFDLIRRGEDVFKEKFKAQNLLDDEWLEILIQYPKLIERPIIVNQGKAVIGRPPERVNEIL